MGRAALGGQKCWQDAAPATGAILLQLSVLGRAGEVSCSSAGGGGVSGTVPKRNLCFLSGVMQCPGVNPSKGWLCGDLVASLYSTNSLELDEVPQGLGFLGLVQSTCCGLLWDGSSSCCGAEGHLACCANHTEGSLAHHLD